jgi:hypothetical protein
MEALMEEIMLRMIGGIRPMDKIADRLDCIPECPGIYLIFANPQMLANSPHQQLERRKLLMLENKALVYIGMASNLRIRLGNHLNSDTRSSSFRMSVAALLRERLKVPIQSSRMGHICYLGEAEERLTNWIRKRTAVLLWPCETPGAVEKALIKHLPCPLNITDRRGHPFSRYLIEQRRLLSGGNTRRRRRPHRSKVKLRLIVTSDHQKNREDGT